MSFSGDPFRVLGLPSGASEDEIKRAYRALAKRYHPDSAGEAALPRFLAIQAAYDLLTGGSAKPKATPPPATPARPSGAESDRARATREAYRARRSTPPPPRQPGPETGWWAAGRQKPSGSTAGGAPSAGPAAEGAPGSTGAGNRSRQAGGDGAGQGSARPGAAGHRGSGSASPGPGSGSAPKADRPPTGARAGASGDAGKRSGGATPGDHADPPPTGGGRRKRPPKVATLGSTSYDDAPAEREPSWSGATWYGGSSGTYWTLNPKEYADPRKHGPEYLARAQRGAKGAPDATPNAPSGGPSEHDQDAARPPDDGSGSGPEATTAGGAAAASAAPGAEATRVSDELPRAGTATSRPPRTPRGAGWRYQQSAPTDAWRSRRGPDPRPRPAPAPDPAPAAGLWPGDLRTGYASPAAGSAAAGAAAPPVGPDDPRDAATDPSPGASLDLFNVESRIPRRLLLAALAWPPLGYLAATVIGEATGCGRFAATCTDGTAALGTLVQPLIILALVLLPGLARPLAVASIATGVAAVFGAVLLSITGGARVPTSSSAPFLIVILVLGYAVGLAAAFSRRVPLPPWLARDG